MKTPWREKVLLGILRGTGAGYAALPRSARGLFARGLGWSLRVIGTRAPIVRQNLDIAFPGENATERALRGRLFKEAYRHIGHLTFEILQVLGDLKGYCERNGELRGHENWKRASDLGRGAIFLSSHVGNWELMAALGALSGMDLMLVTKKLKPTSLHAAIEAGRLTCGVTGTYEPRTLRDVLAHLKRGGTVGLILDQYAGPPIGVRVPVFGVPVGTASTVAAIAKRTGAPVVPVVNYRTSDGRIIVDIQPALNWITDTDVQRELAVNTARYAEVLEQHIRQHPGQWLWIHRRFKGDLSPLREGEWSEGRARH